MTKRKLYEEDTTLYNIPEFYIKSHASVCINCFVQTVHFPLDDVEVINFSIPINIAEDNDSCRHWIKEEEIFLVGLVFDLLFDRGSLAPTKQERKENKTCWEIIKQQFDKVTVRYNFLKRTNVGRFTCVSRSQQALRRHYKVMKATVASSSELCDNGLPLFKSLYEKWQKVYNENDILTCSDSNFRFFLKEMKILNEHNCIF